MESREEVATMSFYIGVIYPDDKGNKWIVLDAVHDVMMVAKMDSRDDVRLAVNWDGNIAEIIGRNGGLLSSKHITGEIL